MPTSKINAAQAPPSSWRTPFRYASRQDAIIIAISSVCAIVAGALVPLNTVVLGSMAGLFQEYTNGLAKAEFDARIRRGTLQFVYLALGEFTTLYIATVGFTHTGENLTRRIRETYLKAVLRQDVAYFDQMGTADITTRITADTNMIQEGISEKLELTLSAFAAFLAAYIVGFIRYWKLTLVLMAITPVLWGAMHGLTTLIIKYTKQSMVIYSQGSALVEETLSSVRTATAFGAQESLAHEYSTYLDRAAKPGLRAKTLAGAGAGFTICILYLGYALAFWLGSKYIVSGETSLSAVLTILLVMMLGAYSLAKAAQYIQAFTNATAAASRIFATIDRASSASMSSARNGIVTELKGRIELRDVKHIYPSRPDAVVLDSLNLVIPAGKMTAITGASGSGKSSIIALLERWYDPVGGEVLVDGHSIEDLDVHWLRQQIGLVPQEPTLFSGTVEANISHGLIGKTDHHMKDPLVRKRLIKEAAEMADAHDFIMELPRGYDTFIGERGSSLSGGQKQRIAIARAAVGNPKILLFDEATSALDSRSEGLVQAAVNRAAQGRTTIVIAHRLSTIQHADNIVVLGPGGRILEQGTYEELYNQDAAFRHLIEAQNMARAVEARSETDLVCNEKNESSAEPTRRIPQTEANKDEEDNTTVLTYPRDQRTPADYTLWSLVAFVASLNRKEWKFMLLGIISAIIAGAGEPAQCVVLAKSVATLSLPAAEYATLRSKADLWSGMYVMIAFVTLLCFLLLGASFAYGSERLVSRSRDRAFRSILRQDIAFFDRPENTVGSLASFLSTETTHLSGMSGLALGSIFQAVATLAIGYVVALAIGWKLALVCLTTVPVQLSAGILNFWSLSRFEAYLNSSYRESASYACEATSSIRTVASLTLEDEVCRQYHDLLVAQSKRSFRFNLSSASLYAASQSVGFLCTALGFWYGSTLIGEYSLFQFYLVFFTVIFGTRSAANMFANAPNMAKAKVAAAELKLLFERKPLIDTWSSDGHVFTDMQGFVELQDVRFGYGPDQPVLQGLNLKALPGQYIALVGASGSGKSTIISLLQRFYDPAQGSIHIDGVNLSQLNLKQYRSHVGLVSQEPSLYQGTIRSNILLGVTASQDVLEEKLIQVCKEANIYDFIASLPGGFDTQVGSKGTMLSGGQKQRIAIARALLRDPKILLLDEAASALDSESERVVQAALDKAAKGRTTIAVAHRLSSVRNADVIHVVERGRVVESGTHEVLMQSKGKYFEMANLQSRVKAEGAAKA